MGNLLTLYVPKVTNMNFLLKILLTLSKEKVMRFSKMITSEKML